MNHAHVNTFLCICLYRYVLENVQENVHSGEISHRFPHLKLKFPVYGCVRVSVVYVCVGVFIPVDARGGRGG